LSEKTAADSPAAKIPHLPSAKKSLKIPIHPRIVTMPRVIITVTDQTPQPYRFQLDRETVQLGRGSENDIAINCGSVSVKHAVMERIPGGYQIRDLGSTNGSKLDGERLPVIPLRDGVTVMLGDVSFDFSLSDEEKYELMREKPAKESKIIAEDVEPAEKKPARRPATKPASPRPVATLASTNPAQSFLAMIVFIIFAALAFYVGLSIRHEKETHQSLMQSMSNKGKPAEPTVPTATEGETTPE
jgi:pSer/pThr/pTyr-binding forkhead associated (FHA) protein